MYKRQAKKALLAYSFPGNVRELENILERAITMCTGGIIHQADLHLRGEARSDAPARPSGSHPSQAGDESLGDKMEDMEREAIQKALEQTRYNKTAAAKLLGISFRALRYRIKKLGME